MEHFDQVFEVLVNWQTMLLCLGVYMGMFVSRKVIEVAWRGARQNRFYNELFLPVGPIAMGVLIASFSKSYPWPMELAETASGMAMYGGVCGLLSGFVYARLRTTLKITEEKKRASMAPPAPEEPEAKPEES